MKYRFQATRTFWRSFGKLSLRQQTKARQAFAIFRQNPFDRRLRFPQDPQAFGSLRTYHLCGRDRNDLRVVFYIEGTTVVTVEIGSHAVYRAKLHAPIESGQSKEAVR